MSTFPLVKGTRARFTKVNSCGMPVQGAANRLVTSGFVTASLTPVMRDAEELEQLNAEGRVCVTDRTPPERKWYTIDLELCNVNTGLIGMLNGWEQVLDASSKSVGFRDKPDVTNDFGVAVEIWTGGRADDDCAIPNTDGVLAGATSGKKYGYLLFAATEFTLQGIEVGAQVSTLTMSGITIAMPHWGKGPYNVVANSGGAAQRLITPTGAKEHFTLLRTSIAPPDETPGSDPCPLAVASIFTGTNYYYGGPSNAAPIAIAPPQEACP